MNFRFEHIEFLPGLALLLVAVLLYLEVLRWKRKTRQKIGEPALVKELTKNYSPLRFALKFILVLVALGATIVAAANLQSQGSAETVSRKGVDVMMVLDVSNSMLAEDIKPSRLERAKQLVTKLLDKMDNDRIGLVLFAGHPYMQMPLTADHAAARMYVQTAGPDAVPTQGTDISEALKMASGGFNSKERKFKAIVLISDGEDHDPEALKTAQSLAQAGAMINTVGIGSPEGVPIIDPATNQTKKDANGSAVITKLNETELQQLSQATNGIYVHLDDVDETAAKIMAQLDSIEQKATNDKSFVDYHNYFQWFLGFALLLLLTESLLPERKMTIA